jgi:hypothetical protein
MEDYIFLIIAVALSIFGAINQNKKKKNLQDQPAGKPDRPGNSFMDHFLADSFLDEKPQEVKPKVMVRRELKKEPMPVPMTVQRSGPYKTSFVSSLPDRSKKPLQPTLKKQMVELIDTEAENEETTDYLEDFSLRKAFIYSEILQRKY